MIPPLLNMALILNASFSEKQQLTEIHPTFFPSKSTENYKLAKSRFSFFFLIKVRSYTRTRKLRAMNVVWRVLNRQQIGYFFSIIYSEEIKVLIYIVDPDFYTILHEPELKKLKNISFFQSSAAVIYDCFFAKIIRLERSDHITC